MKRLHRLLFVTVVTAGSFMASNIARAQVIAHPNQIKGTVEFTNVDPSVLAILNAPTDSPPGLDYGMDSLDVDAWSRPPQSPRLHAVTYVQTESRLGGGLRNHGRVGASGHGNFLRHPC